ncbi:alpha-amylase [Thermogladius sp. 4427co]|uniref:alpha-amylase n=1 Tax=Thermogladius sp. 4427co TaxID=3450718 RepID=UPI003F7AB104
MDKEFWDRALGTLLGEYVTRARWWPWKTGGRKPGVVKKAVGDGILHVRITDGEEVYQASFTYGEPSNLPEENIVRFEGRMIYEAEYDKRFLSLAKTIEGLHLDFVDGREPRVLDARPLTLESTNALALLETDVGRLVLKSYRLVPRVNIEVECLTKLRREGYRNTPQLKGVVYEEGEPIAIITGYVKGFNDAGYPFYTELLKWLSGTSTTVNVGLSAKLGVVVGGLHKALNKPGDHGFFGLEQVADSDISRWASRIEKRVETALELFDAYLSAGRFPWLEYWRSLFEDKALPVVREAVSQLDLYSKGFKARTHQDLHLLQMIYNQDENEFYIIDFEGEPGRSLEERLEKEPPLRDIASLARSFHYLSFAAVMNAYGKSIDETARSLLENDPSTAWRVRHLKSMVYSYLASTVPGDLHGFGPRLLEKVDEFLKPWIVERALYELVYELKYRPEWAPIPLLGILKGY